MKCPYCDYDTDKVINSRPTDEGCAIRRRRECLNCGKRYTTYERYDNVPILVIKKDKSRQAYDRQKLLSGLIKACEKRPISADLLENIVNDIENQIYNSMKREITSIDIGELVMSKLKSIDEIAYVRFASVYRQFKDINTFMDELKKLINERS